MPKETELVKNILAALKHQGVEAYRNNSGVTRSGGRFVRYGLEVGSADIVAVVPPSGRFLAIEVKVEKGRTTPAQDAWLARVRESGGVAGVARSVSEALALLELARGEMAA